MLSNELKMIIVRFLLSRPKGAQKCKTPHRFSI